MTLEFIVAWAVVSYDCPWGLGRAPELVKQFACASTRRVESARFKDESGARRKLIELGPCRDDVLVLAVDADKNRTLPVAWIPYLQTGRR